MPSKKGIGENLVAWAILLAGGWLIHHATDLATSWLVLIVAVAFLASGVVILRRDRRQRRRPRLSATFMGEGNRIWLEVENHGPNRVPDPPLLINLLFPRSWELASDFGGFMPSREPLINAQAGRQIPAALWAFEDDAPPKPGVTKSYPFRFVGATPIGPYPVSTRLVDYGRFDGMVYLEGDPESSGLVIKSAKYGVPGKEADVKERLTELIDEDGVLDFEVTYAYLQVDPAPGEDKTLRLRWTDNGNADASAFREYTHVVIPRSAARAQ